MITEVGGTVHPWYKGIREWQVEAIARLPQPIRYPDPNQGDVSYDPKIVWLKCPEHSKVLWFAYWISTNKTKGRMKWGQGAPMLEEDVLLTLLKDAISQNLFSKNFLGELASELGGALNDN